MREPRYIKADAHPSTWLFHSNISLGACCGSSGSDESPLCLLNRKAPIPNANTKHHKRVYSMMICFEGCLDCWRCFVLISASDSNAFRSTLDASSRSLDE